MREVVLGSRLVVEPSGAVAAAAYLFARDQLPKAARTVAVLSGGNVSPALLAEILLNAGVHGQGSAVG
jgi:threonine dehydratase